MARLPRRFYARDSLDVARDLLGCCIVRGDVRLRITETEAYRWPGDSACHARSGRTKRNAALWGPPGRAYVYLCYGLHQMLNVVTGEDGEASAVLIRACEPVAGLSLIRARRGGKSGPVLLTGPGKVGAALDIDTTWSDHALYRGGGVSLVSGSPPTRVLSGPRVGIDFANARDKARRWRFAAGGTEWVTQRASLAPA